MKGYVTVDYDATKTKLSEACRVISVIAREKADFTALDKLFRTWIGDGCFKESISPPNHAAVHAIWDGLYGGFTPPHGTDNDARFMYNHRHFELVKGMVKIQVRIALAKLLSKNGIDLSSVDDYG